ncbi:MAG: rod shape-determining protein MreD [Pseudomonadota bacterium]|nr:rod shape-determining protein MreD [Gammaproteobacteria bacterium]MBU1558831.1 rod shape-determining protein MreD [Gammaproteobacteria bacterium]MBU1628712.1 rod shape-determining protein MreD [Gammaproteobacteria bacterium]MBU1926272.1 rod shape-determining protein MreD [Gammaproteobacteria bacterium]MBU2545710.1 rod shape-determining protein MreD [Gammaproteobacteria bacterium]
MFPKNKHKHSLILITVLIALMLDILPLPRVMIWIRPHWVFLVFVYWTLALPEVVGLAYAFFIGVFFDLLSGALLGEHAFAFVVISYILLKTYKLVRVYPLFQQTLVVALLLVLYQVILLTIQGTVHPLMYTPLYGLTVLTSTLLWPLIFMVLRDYRLRFQIN